MTTVYAVDAAEIRLSLPDSEFAYLDLPLFYGVVVLRAVVKLEEGASQPLLSHGGCPNPSRAGRGRGREGG